ncbi:MAG: flagellin, partial [Phycisphaeraceae bacterium]|nr:flagellin [Phycisphaeraceae bacterium]
MSRISTNVSSMLAQRVLTGQNTMLTKSLERLSTGYRINRGADDPAGLIASEKLRSEKVAISAAIGNAERADQVLNVAEGGLQELNSMLVELQDLVGRSANEAGLSREELEANQLQIDSILQTIDRISQTTSFEGTKLLNGTYDFKITSQHGKVLDYRINAAKLEHGDTRDVQVAVTGSAQHGTVFLSAGGTSLSLTSSNAKFVFEIAGAKGSREFSFNQSASLSTITTQINTFKEVLGVSAAASGQVIKLKSTETGSDNFVKFSIQNIAGQAGWVYTASSTNENAIKASTVKTFAALGDGETDAGQDVAAVINGITATGKGNTANVSSDFIDLSLTLSAAGAQALGSFTAFTITGGGAKFNLGPNVDIINQVSVGIQNVAIRKLGNATDGFLSDLAQGGSANVVDGDLAQAQSILSASIDQVSSLRGRLGAFQKNIVGATIRSLGVALENTSAAESTIRDTDFAAETAEMTRAQILVSAATNTLAIANNRPSSVLQ